MRVCLIQSKMLFFIIKITMYWLKIIGLAPFSMPIKISGQTYSHQSNIRAFQYSKIGLAYNILFLIPTLIALVSSFYWLSISEKDSQTWPVCTALTIFAGVEISCITLSACIVIISWSWKLEEGASIMNRLFEVDTRLSILNHQPFNKRGLILITVHVIINISFFIIFWIRRIIYFSIEIMAIDFVTSIPHYIMHWFAVEYFIVVDFLAQYFQMVNKYLLNLNEFGDYSSRSRVRTGNSLVPVLSVLGNHSSQLSSLRLLLSVRTQLYDLCEDISRFFSVPILFCLACCFSPLVRELYGAITTNYLIHSDIGRAVNGFYVIFMVFFYAYPIMSLASNVARTGKEARITGQIVHKLLSAHPMRKEIKSELTEFSLQLLHEDVTFTAWGLLTLDATMLIRILGMAVSYFFGIGQLQTNAGCRNWNNTTS